MTFEHACCMGDSDVIDWYVTNHDVDLNAIVEERENHGDTPLMTGVRNGNFYFVRRLVTHFGVDMDGPVNEAGFRAIDLAAKLQMFEPAGIAIYDWLKKMGSKTTWWGAAMYGDFPRIQEFLDNGQDIDEINPIEWNRNAVEMAIEQGQGKCAKWLVTKGATIMVRNCNCPMTRAEAWDIGREESYYHKEELAKEVRRQKEDFMFNPDGSIKYFDEGRLTESGHSSMDRDGSSARELTPPFFSLP